MMTGTAMAEFLSARLVEREAVAEAAMRLRVHKPEPWYEADDDRFAFSGDAAHIALNDPAYVLADIAAKRRILAEVVELIDSLDARIESEWGSGAYRPTGESDLLLQLLALPFADHPDYDPAWRLA
jgi:hypothetical protein